MNKRLLVSGTAILLAACVSIGDDAQLDFSLEPTHAELRRRMNVRVVTETASPQFPPEGVTPETLLDALRVTCEAPAGSSCAASTCDGARCRSEREICVANRLLEIVESPMGLELDFVEPYASGGRATIPQQDAETNEALSALAYQASAAALRDASTALGETCSATDLDAIWRGEHPLSVYFAIAQADAFQLARQSVAALTASATAVVEGATGRFEEIRAASEYALAARAYANLFIMGGTSLGMAGLDAGFCPVPRPGSEVSAAIGVLRRTAPPPSELLLDGSIDGFVQEHVQPRLAILDADTELGGLATANDVYAHLGISRDGFLGAREYLRSEIHAFDRQDVDAPAIALPGEGWSDDHFDRSAALASPPQLPSDAYYGAAWGFSRAQFLPGDPLGSIAVPFGGWREVGGQLPSYASLIDGYVTGLTRLLAASGSGFGSEATRVRELIALQLADADTLRPGRVDACYYYGGGGSADSIYLRVFGRFGSPQELEVVRGHAGLQCATLGTVEGAPCELADYLHVAPSHLEFDGPVPAAGAGFPEFFERTVRDYNVPPSTALTNATQLFVVSRRAGTAGDEGDWDVFGGVTLPVPTSGATGWRYCVHAPVVPDAWAAAKGLFGSSPDHCGESARRCGGVQWDQRLPLENELTSDGDAIESSWRHYLSLAANAAALSDELGEEVIRAGLEMDLRAEAAVGELSRLCGVSLNPTGFGDIATRPRTVPATMGACDAEQGYRFEDGQCVLDPVVLATSMAASSEDAARLAACLGAGATIPWATLGATPLCIWESGPNELCGGATSTHPCPYPADPLTRACADGRPPGVLGEVIAVSRTLGLFHEPDPAELGPNPGRLSREEFRCREIAAARASGTPLPSTPLRSATHLAGVVDRLSWSAGAGDYSTVLWDNGSLFRTGSAALGPPASGWPCGPAPTCAGATSAEGCVAIDGCTWTGATCTGAARDEYCPSGAFTSDPAGYRGPLFCLRDACGEPDAFAYESAVRIRRAQVNDLLARAVMAARLLGGRSFEGLRVPFYPRAEDTTVWLTNPPGWSTASPVAGLSFPEYGYQRTLVGNLRIDNAGGGESYRVVDSPLAGLGLTVVERILGPVDALEAGSFPTWLRAAEWTACPYDRTALSARGVPCTEVFDDGASATGLPPWQDDLDDVYGSDRQVPFMLRTLGDTSGVDPGTAVAVLWRELDAALASPREHAAQRIVTEQNSTFPIDYLTALTTYWRRANCGLIGDDDCNRDPRRVRDDQAECYTNNGPQSGSSRTCDSIGCDDRYFQCRDRSGAVDFLSTFDGNRAFIAPHGLTAADFLNGLELVCFAERTSSPGTGFDCPPGPPEVNSVVDMYQLEAFLRCKAARIRSSAAAAVIRDMPERVFELTQRQGAGGVHGDVAGEYGAATSELAAAYVELRDAEDTIATTIDDLANQIDLVQNAIAQSGIAAEIEDLQLVSTVADRVTQCVSSVGQVIDSASKGVAAGSAVTMAAVCTNTAIQIGLATRIHDLQRQGIVLQNEAAFINFDTHFNALSRSLSAQATAIHAAVLRIAAAHSRLATLRREGRRAAAQALLLDTDDVGQQFAVHGVLRARYSTVLHRYREAHQRAVRLTFIARRALEQRLGMPLESMTNDLVSVAAPSRWQGALCTLPSIDYDRIRAVMTGEDGRPVIPPDGYAGAYVGDYVRRLEQVFESYNFEYPFADGTDVAVISLRDELHSIRELCETATPNLLFHGGQLNVAPTEEAGGWAVEGCAPVAPPSGSPVPPPSCVAVTDLDERAIAPGAARFGTASGMRVEFGTEGGSDPLRDTLTTGSRVAQWVELQEGRHRVSWYGRPTPGAAGTGLDPQTVVRLVRALHSGEEDLTPSPTRVFSNSVGAASGWTRYWFFVDVSRRSEAAVTIDAGYEETPTYRVVDVAGLMVEDVSGAVLGDTSAIIGTGMAGPIYLGAVRHPPPFFATGAERTRRLPVCIDTDGSTFRSRAWSYGCVPVCPDGYDGTCGSAARSRCYWQTSFSVASDSLQQLAGRSPAGFAAGNYNYRMESVGLNLVGVGLRDCERLGGGLGGCYASGNLSYSILHDGPYPVRNARGEIYDAPLFRGRVESARALAAERYVGNPLSSADRSLIEPYLRHELRGRPLGGTFVVRLWDDEGFAFDRLEDVQLVLQYRYWQRQR